MSKSNSKQWSSATPGYIIFLVDQSGSMEEAYAQGKNKAQFTAMVINRTINELINTNMDGNKVKDRVFMTIIGYGGKGGNSVENVQSDYLSIFADKPIRLEKTKKKISDGAGGLVEIEEEMPIFIEPLANGFTPMGHAFEYAKQLIEGWLQKKPDNPAPVIINVSDGIPYDGRNDMDELNKTVRVVGEIMTIDSSDGTPLVFNAHIGTGMPKCGFEESESEVSDPQARYLFNISSRIPETYKAAARKFDIDVKPNSKGFVSNADPETLIRFINFGSSGGVDKND